MRMYIHNMLPLLAGASGPFCVSVYVFMFAKKMYGYLVN
jgi:hypothetical protein